MGEALALPLAVVRILEDGLEIARMI